MYCTQLFLCIVHSYGEMKWLASVEAVDKFIFLKLVFSNKKVYLFLYSEYYSLKFCFNHFVSCLQWAT